MNCVPLSRSAEDSSVKYQANRPDDPASASHHTYFYNSRARACVCVTFHAGSRMVSSTERVLVVFMVLTIASVTVVTVQGQIQCYNCNWGSGQTDTSNCEKPTSTTPTCNGTSCVKIYSSQGGLGKHCTNYRQ